MDFGAILWIILGGLVMGLIIGPLARMVIPGKQDISMVWTIVIGAIGAIGGGFLYEAFGGEETAGIDWIRLAVQVGVGVVLVLLYVASKRSSSGTTAI